ncbi:MAG: ABC transporter permease [Verrucomicrobiales bacterium]|jgi:peptide/nickel transport system permease protein/oligopeptide transport system permease protein|nr:ABC transporter permease [Verrucomicrobiales bacterium]
MSPRPIITVSVALLALVLLAAWLGPALSPYAYDDTGFAPLAPPSATHWFGTDANGRDVLTRALCGARISLLVGAVGALVSLSVGVCYGMVSGQLGGKADGVMMRLVDILYSLPRLVIVILLISVLDEKFKILLGGWRLPLLQEYSRLLLLFAGLGLVEWLTMARIVRGQVLTLKERQFVQAAQVLGQSRWRVMCRHLLPNLSGVILVYLTLTIPAVILEESFLSFLGLGVQAPQASWGTLLSEGAGFINPIETAWWLLAGPGLLIAVTLLALNFLGDALRDRCDPRTLTFLRRRR